MATVKKPQTQCEVILKHLKTHKGITVYDAINKYGVLRLSAVIFDLRKAGYNIINDYQLGVDVRGKQIRFVKYRLVKEGK